LRECAPQDRQRQRQADVRPIIETIFQRVEAMKAITLPAEPLAKAIGYVENQRVPLRRFLDDGRLAADNNTAENAIRSLAVGRKNWLFAGSERGGQAAALYLGLIQSCKACDVNPWAYFDDILRRIMAHPVRQLRQLLPDQWRPLERNTCGLILNS
jgi:transposase